MKYLSTYCERVTDAISIPDSSPSKDFWSISHHYHIFHAVLSPRCRVATNSSAHCYYYLCLKN
eukprot:scaffold7190_cov193-Amphora_coffeaeformis.AAC.7